MKLTRLEVHNFKSLRHVVFSPKELSVLVGPNAAGKSNFADALDFLSEVYRHGLELAVARKGGFENIAFRRARRSKAAIEFAIELEVSGGEMRRALMSVLRSDSRAGTLRLRHSFTIKSADTTFAAEYSVVSEKFSAAMKRSESDVAFAELMTVTQIQGKEPDVKVFGEDSLAEALNTYARGYKSLFGASMFSRQDLVVNSVLIRNPILAALRNAASEFAVFRIVPMASRRSGVPSPNPALSMTGENLPSLVDWLKKKHPRRWATVLSGMRDVLPSLEDITVAPVYTRTLGLFLHEEGYNRPWSSEDVSDGTIQTLALLCAVADPRIRLIVIEEPENSVHPWVIRVLIERFRSLSKEKAVVVTTHSPVVIDLMRPDEVWVVSRHNGETALTSLAQLDPSLVGMWEDGKTRLSEYLDAGFIPRAVPGGTEGE